MAIKSFLVLIFLFYGTKSVEIPYDICEGISFGYLAHPDPQRCTEYIICLFEEFHVFNCSYPGHIFYLPYTYCVRGDPETCQVLIQVTTLSPDTTLSYKPTTTTTFIMPTISEATTTDVTTTDDTTTEDTTTESSTSTTYELSSATTDLATTDLETTEQTTMTSVDYTRTIEKTTSTTLSHGPPTPPPTTLTTTTVSATTVSELDNNFH